MRFVLDSSSPKMWGKEEAKDVAPWTAPKWILPMQELGWSVSCTFGVSRGLPVVETEDSSRYIQCDMLRDSSHVSVECSAHKIVVAEYECLLWVEAHCNNILCIVPAIALDLLYCAFLGEDVFLVIRKHDN